MRTLFLVLLTCLAVSTQAKDYTLASPDGQLQVTVHAGADRLTWAVRHGSTPVLAPSEIGLNGPLTKLSGRISGHGLTLSNRLFSVEFRVDNDAAAYRISVLGKQPLTVDSETAEFNFAADYPAFVPYVNDNRGGERYTFSFESYYDEQPLSQVFPDSLAINPLAVRLPEGKLAVIADMGSVDYPGMFLLKNGAHGLKAAFAPYPTSEVIGGHARLNLVPVERASYIARDVKGQLPWRIVMVTTQDSQLLTARLPQRFGPRCQLADTSWIQPGKVAWDWWNATMLTGVPFRAGMNTETYLYYIDFAAANRLEYIIIDEGWSGKESLRDELNPDIDLPRLLAYGKEKGVGIILWSSWRNAVKQTEADFRHYADMGVKGFKVDFFDRDDQVVMRSAWQLAACAARHHLLLDYHGYRPTGIQVAWPNIVNFEGVKGLENSKWEPRVGDGPLHNQPRYDVTIPYLRQLVGPLDYTPGAMSNATRAQFFGNNDHPMSQGTRAHQVAMYTLFDAPLQMLADAPSKYMKEQETTDFIRQIPTVWDEVVAIGGELGAYVAVAKRKGQTWYLAAMTDWQPRTITIPLAMLGDGSHQAEIFADGVNADRDATDYQKTVRTVGRGDTLTVSMAPGGGWSAIVK
ncbi:MAG: glycoside hydrolase family 97 catalytic domain-containing protein [Prevotella sp.]|nr:glycoside hydrolase family 97 catalytic domain-containing protein [Prevotella sp.]